MDDKCNMIVYGSLKKGFSNHGLMGTANATFIGSATSLEPKFKMYGVGKSFPGLVSGNSFFTGEVYELSIKNVEYYIDFLEGYPHFYTRNKINVKLNDTNEVVNTWVYMLSDDYLNGNKTYLISDLDRLKFNNNTYEWGA